MRKIIHIDMDAFYASVEQRDNPNLRGKPVAVGHVENRGVVAAASYEARTFGIRSAMPSVTARRKCPELIFVAPRFDVYRSISHDIRQIFSQYTGNIEPVAFDEAYLDVTHNLGEKKTAWATAHEIRSCILERTGLTASAGVSFNKFLAKLASGCRKPNGQFAVLPEEAEEFVARLPVTKFHGIGPVTAKKMNDLGIHTGADLRAQSLEFLVEHFGKAGRWYSEIARGEDHRPVEHDRIRKSFSSETTFRADLNGFSEIEAEVLAMADEVWKWCQRANVFGRTITVKLKFADFQQITRSRSASTPVNDQAILRSASIDLLRSVFPLEKDVRLVGVAVSNLHPRATGEWRQLGLAFAD